ncbi:MAG: NADH-quinone oxidoreductase subunit J [Oscillochloridaceae bacterium]|nr:NADH-quinone oxidoreductase subunit J [Chloroflexaceae bacterium]MDW8390354.1 NADH-quinone oxidoreductase subunit J [Oscillochloridaceae bacterium]
MDFVLFFITAAVALIGAIAMLVARNAVHSALFLLLNFAAIAVLFLLLQSPFLFAIQLTVYAGAIMVLFLFVVMLLGAERVEDTPDRIAWQRPLALALGVALVAVAVVSVLRGARAAPPGGEAAAAFGDPAQLGALLFTGYLLPFQVTGIILLIAVVGVAVLNQRGRAASAARRGTGVE